MPSQIQSVLFDKNYWKIFDSINWLHSHHIYPIKSPHITENFIRFRVRTPEKYKRFITKKLPKSHIDLVIGFY